MNRPRRLAYVLVAALALAATAGGVGYAAGSSSKTVSACVNGKGRLALQNAKGKCPKKFAKVAIAKQGPRGARGATGPRGGTGKTGAQGPGATALVQDLTATGTGARRVVGGLAYTPSCSIGIGSGTFALVEVRAVSGASVSVHGIRNIGGSTLGITAGPAASITIVFASANSGTSTSVAPGALVFSGTTTQTVSFSVTALAAGAPGGVLCRIRGTITPAA